MERLQKILAQAGIASRRKCEELILGGRVTVDGVVCTTLGTRADPAKQQIAVDGKPVQLEQKTSIILYKPTSYVTTVTDPEGRRTVMDLVRDLPVRIFPVGRLDYDTSGLLILTNDGELANGLAHPGHDVDKVYRVTVIGMPDKTALQTLKTGVELEDGTTKPAQVTVLRNHPFESVLEIAIHEGRNRQIRRMFEAIGLPVKRLKRIQFGPIELTGLNVGQWRWLNEAEWKALYSSAGLSAPPYTGPAAFRPRKTDKTATKTSRFQTTKGRQPGKGATRSYSKRQPDSTRRGRTGQ
ncbi:rRNA pseudouridine synthase [Alicyclobacillus tolerans]|uniref:pseudouridine synthase n=1 Tax=Alicyclobacillus tolerans TaxID=90970 RepID=UPI001F378549|nr:pseudouridine synthase [Alicyclobacillus tolerans]MCF8563691.1 rRNA pseudouridine synthase [Alicyclobacillus tolerans]